MVSRQPFCRLFYMALGCFVVDELHTPPHNFGYITFAQHCRHVFGVFIDLKAYRYISFLKYRPEPRQVYPLRPLFVVLFVHFRYSLFRYAPKF